MRLIAAAAVEGLLSCNLVNVNTILDAPKTSPYLEKQYIHCKDGRDITTWKKLTVFIFTVSAAGSLTYWSVKSSISSI